MAINAQTKKPKQSPVPDFATGAWVPLHAYAIIKRQKPRTETAGGIALPDTMKIPQTWGQVLKLPETQGYDDNGPLPVEVLDYVIYNPEDAVPLDIETAVRRDKSGTHEDLFVVPVNNLLAVFKSGEHYGE